MSRIVRTGDTPAKRRNAHARSCAEALRLLAQRPGLADGRFGPEERDLVAFIVFNLRGLNETIEQSAQSWDDRGYWKKSEALRERYRWSAGAAAALESAALAERWSDVPSLLLDLVPHFNGVTIQQITRDADWWCGAHRALQRDAARRQVVAP